MPRAAAEPPAARCIHQLLNHAAAAAARHSDQPLSSALNLHSDRHDSVCFIVPGSRSVEGALVWFSCPIQLAKWFLLGEMMLCKLFKLTTYSRRSVLLSKEPWRFARESSFFHNIVVVVCIRSHNWSDRQRHHRLQSVVLTSHRVVLSVAGFDNVWHRLGRTAGTLIGVWKFPFLLTGTAVTLSGAETVQERPLLLRKSKARLSDCGVVHDVCIDHRGRLPGFCPLTVDVNWFRLPVSGDSLSKENSFFYGDVWLVLQSAKCGGIPWTCSAAPSTSGMPRPRPKSR